MIKTPDVLIFKPIFKERIWGGQALRTLGYEIPKGNIGECWGISGHPHGITEVSDGLFIGRKLDELYNTYPQWFNNEKKKNFPLLIKILDAKQDLSVQVHPNDEYAQKNENDLGKHEAWIVLDAQKYTRIQIGHHVTTKLALINSIKQNQWATLLHYYPSIRKFDYIDIPPGTLHALCEGSLILEIQQSSDVTYRVYDYNRFDKDNKKRELHLDKAIDVINIPDQSHKINHINFEKLNNLIPFIINDKFTLFYVNKIYKYPFSFNRKNYLCGFLLDGELIIKNKIIKPNTFFIIPSSNQPIFVEGNFKAIFSESH
jgi:mannose-6-phosphate isomerase